jgi:hypothetical protein
MNFSPRHRVQAGSWSQAASHGYRVLLHASSWCGTYETSHSSYCTLGTGRVRSVENPLQLYRPINQKILGKILPRLLKRSDNISSAFCPHRVFTHILRLLEQTAIISLASIKPLVFVMGRYYVFCRVEPECFNII